MISDNFKLNWLKILSYNSNVEILGSSETLKEQVRVPFTPIKIDAYISYSLFELLYPKFVNDQQNILDLVISDDGDEILKIILYETKIVGIHESYQSLPTNIIDLQGIELDGIDKYFNKIQKTIVEKKGVRISSLRIFRKSAIDAINNHCDGIENLSFYDFLRKLMSLIEKIFSNDLFYIYPEPNLFKFLKNLMCILNGVKLIDIFEFISKILPDLNASYIINSEKLRLILKFQNKKLNSDKSELVFSLHDPKELGINAKEMSIDRLLSKVKNILKSEKVYFLNLKHIITLLTEIFELEIPWSKDTLFLIFQKFLFGFRTFEENWYMAPRPKAYNTLRRFIIRLLGVNFNLKKISHWTIPELISNSIDSYLGLNSKILLILTDINSKKLNKKGKNLLQSAFCSAILIELENGNLAKIHPINKVDIFVESKINNLETIRTEVSRKFGFVHAVMNMDILLLKEVMANFGPNLSKLKPFSKSKAIKMLKHKSFFNIYPELPPYKLIQEISVKSIVKMFLPIFIDKHEF